MRALLLCASHNDLGLVGALRKLGYEILVTGNVPGQPGEKYADQYIQMDYSDKEAILRLARKEKIDVICQCCNDFGVYTAAYVAEKLGLPGYDSYETTLILHNKDKFKKFAKENGINTPGAEMFEDVEQALEWVSQAEFPLIVKPTDASAGNGIQKITSFEEASDAVQAAFKHSKVKKIVIEKYLQGTQHGFCTFLRNKKVAAFCSNNEYSILNPYRVEIDTFPAEHYEQAAPVLIEQIEQIANILNLKDGIFHLQYIMVDNVPYIIEVMRRVLGNMYSVPANLLNNFNWDYWETRAKCGLSCEEIPQNIRQEGFYAYKAILAKENGVIESIQVPIAYQKYLIGKLLLKDVGDLITRYQSEPVGFLFFMFASEREMKQVLVENYADDLVGIKGGK